VVWSAIVVLLFIYALPSIPSEAQPWQRLAKHVTRDLVTAGLLLVLLGLLVLINLALLERAWRRIRHGAPVPSGHVLIQSPKGSAMVPSGATVSLALGAGEPEIDQPGEHEKRAPDPTPFQQSVAAARFAFVSKVLEIEIKRGERALNASMRFKNVGPGHLRWEMEQYRTTVNDRANGATIYLTKRGTVEPGDDVVWPGPAVSEIDLTQELNGLVEFSFLYGPPQQPKAYRTKESWRFVLTPNENEPNGFGMHSYRSRESDEPC
jgi:hypothetical protein